MFQTKLIIKNKTGLHARPASDLVQCAQKFESDITIVANEEEINAKSIVSVLSGGIHAGTEILLQVEGIDEDAAGKALVDLIESLID